jgi:hypothetical protein
LVRREPGELTKTPRDANDWLKTRAESRRISLSDIM